MERELRRFLRHNREIPVLLAEEYTPKQWKVWCPYCRLDHFHGAREGLRTAHCAREGFEDTGYVIVLAKDATNIPKGLSTNLPDKT